jgi:hypothetical protein
MRWQNLFLTVCILGLCNPGWVLAQATTKGATTGAAIAPEAELARGKAQAAQKIAAQASRKAVKAAEEALALAAQAGAGNDAYYVETNNQGYRYQGLWQKTGNIRLYNGLGILSWPNHNRYEGKFLKGHKNGNGVFTGPNGDHYEGEWRTEINGHGKYTYPNGERYEGEFTNGNRQGYGVMIYPNGERYAGEWQNNQKSGYGVQTNRQGMVEYAGIW